jgi:hypothetical protein
MFPAEAPSSKPCLVTGATGYGLVRAAGQDGADGGPAVQ